MKKKILIQGFIGCEENEFNYRHVFEHVWNDFRCIHCGKLISKENIEFIDLNKEYKEELK